MTEERYTLEEAAILLNRQACEREGHQIKRIKASGWVADEKDHYRCGRCDVWIEFAFTYPPGPADGEGQTKAHPLGSSILADRDAEPSPRNVAFEVGGLVHVIQRGGPLDGGDVRSPLGRWWSFEWHIKDGPSLGSWGEVLRLSMGAPIHAWDDGEWIRGEVKP